MKTISLTFFLFLSISLFSQTHPFAVHPDCDKTLEAEALKQCSEEKIISAIHEIIRYKHYENNQFSIVELEFDINDEGYIEPVRVNTLKGVDAQRDIEDALKNISYQMILKPAEEEGITFFDNKKLVVKFTESDFLEGADVKAEAAKAEEKILPENHILAKKYIDAFTPTSINDIYKEKEIDQKPRFFSLVCEELEGNHKVKKECADKKLLEFIYKNIKYPAIARENGVEGTVVIQLIVETDGTMSDVRVVRDIGSKCGAESLRAVNAIKDFTLWIPGILEEKTVRVQLYIPVNFRLE